MPEILDPVTQHHVDQAAARLAEEFKGVFSEETIARYIARVARPSRQLADQHLRARLAHRFARERLRALAQVEGKMTKEAARGALRLRPQRRPQPDGRRPREASLRGRIHVRSAGSDPADEINPA